MGYRYTLIKKAGQVISPTQELKSLAGTKLNHKKVTSMKVTIKTRAYKMDSILLWPVIAIAKSVNSTEVTIAAWTKAWSIEISKEVATLGVR